MEKADIRTEVDPIEAIQVDHRELDLLFVIDNSGSMRDEQANLLANFKHLMFELNSIPGGFPNTHIGVVSSDMGPMSVADCGNDEGRLLSRPRGSKCRGPQDADFIRVENHDGRLELNVADVATPVVDAGGNPIDCLASPSGGADGYDVCDIHAAFSCIADLGTDGCGFEQHLAAAARALEPGVNEGFVRDHSLVTVVVLADEDDCSVSDPALLRNPSFDPVFGTGNFRCFEYGVTCDQPIDRLAAQALTGCGPRTGLTASDNYLHAPAHFVSAFREIRPPGQFLMAVLAGPWNPGDRVYTTLGEDGAELVPSCGLTEDGADPAIRLRATVEALADDGFISSAVNVCSDDYSPALEELSARIDRGFPRVCFDYPLATVEGTPISTWSEAACGVSEVHNSGYAEQRTESVPRCLFLESRAEACPQKGSSPGNVVESPCWFTCDSSVLPALQGCAPPDFYLGNDAWRWQMRLCHDGTCDPAIRPATQPLVQAQCVACDPANEGCLLQ